MRMSPKRLWIAVTVVVVVSALLLLFVAPLPEPFAYRGVVDPVGGLGGIFSCGGIRPTDGTRVYFAWSAPGNITFDVWRCTGHRTSDGYTLNIAPIYQANGTRGSGSFVASGAIYFFGTVCTAIGNPPPPCIPSNVSGYFFGPILSRSASFGQPPGMSARSVRHGSAP